MLFFIRKDCLNALAIKPITIEDSLLNGDVFSALQLAETPDTKIKRLFKIKHCLGIPNKRVFRPQFERPRGLRAFCLPFPITGDNDVRPQIKIVNHCVLLLAMPLAAAYCWPASQSARPRRGASLRLA